MLFAWFQAFVEKSIFLSEMFEAIFLLSPTKSYIDFFAPKDSPCDGLQHIKNLARAQTCKWAKIQKWQSYPAV